MRCISAVQAQVLVDGHLRPADLAREPFVSAVLQCFTLAACQRSREAAAALLSRLTPSAKHLAVLKVHSSAAGKLAAKRWGRGASVAATPHLPALQVPGLVSLVSQCACTLGLLVL